MVNTGKLCGEVTVYLS